MKPQSCITILLMSGVFLAMPLLADAEARVQPQRHSVSVGQTLVLEAPEVKRVAIGNGDIAEVKVLEDSAEVLLIAKLEGVTDVRIWKKEGKPELHLLQVDGFLSGPSRYELEQLTREMAGVKINRIKNSYVLDGTVAKEQDLLRAQQIAEQFPNVFSLVTASPFEHQQTVLLHARFVEINRNALKNIGINWADLMNGPVFAFLGDFQTNNLFRGSGLPGNSILAPGTTSLPVDVGNSNSYLGLSTSVDSVINLLDNNGDARLLAEPTLSCISGGEARFLAGGEFPIPYSDEGDVTVEFREYGISLEVSPLVDQRGYILSRVKVEVSSIDQSVTVLGVPGLLKRTTETQMNVYDGQTMVIAGLFSQEDSKIVDKVPGLGDLPILGELFKSREFRNNETELVVLVTPTLITADSEQVRQSETRFGELFAEGEARVKFNLMD